MKKCIALVCFLSFMACKDTSVPASQSESNVDLSGYMLDNSGSITVAIKKNNAGQIIEKGYLQNGQKHGTWITFYDKTEHPKTIQHYINGVLTGPSLQIDSRGAIKKYDEYLNNRLDGLTAQYKKGFPEYTTQYKDGKKEGKSRTYFNYSTDVQKEVDYSKDQLNGTFSQYNEDGELILEYKYKNGEKVSGGVTTN